MKQFFLFSALSFVFEMKVFSQPPTKMLTSITKEIIAEALPEVLGTKTFVVLSTSQAEKLLKYGIILSSDKKIVYYHGKMYQSPSEFLHDYFTPNYNDSENDPQAQAARELIEIQKKSSSSMQSNQFDGDKNIARIQRALIFLGYPLKCDGLLGPKTMVTITKVFRVDCSGLSNKEICDKIFFKEGSKSYSQSYKLIVRKENEGPTFRTVDNKLLKNALDEYTCGIEEICASFNEKWGGGITFNCKDKSGNNIALTISSETASIELNLKSVEDQSTNFSIDKNGKIIMSNSDGNYIRGINSQL